MSDPNPDSTATAGGGTRMPEDVYTHGHHESVLRSHVWRTAENSAAYLLPHLRSGLAVLDVGCGPGTITADLAERVAPGRVVGLDREESPLVAARAEAAQRGLANASYAVGDVYALDFPDGTFDVIHAHQVLQHLTDPVAALREMARVAKPGGLLAVRDADYAAMTWHPASDGLTRWLELYRAVARSNDAEPDAGRRLKAWALAAGLSDVTASASTWCFADPAEVAWWSGLWADRVTESGLAQQAVARGLAAESDLADLAAAWRAWGAEPAAWFTVVHGELLARV
jgi:2-polyprenyl-3-methyl-5-hydroxy-6-metoxy-1,4-benzoquinol methylase